ncbi:MAG TPA: hypothetical protein VFY44_02915 [Thermoleophilaceae bacterium]|nr:hypothetical protein [Thermoleophilaceae bacterium]
MNVRRHVRRPRASTLIASLALFVALGGSATAATLITGAQIKNGSITGKDVKASSVTGADVKNGALGSADFSRSTKASSKGERGTQGAAGQAGAPGGQGVPGPNGVRAPERSNLVANINGGDIDSEILTKEVPPGQYLVTAKGMLFAGDAGHVTCRLRNGGSTVDRIDWDATAAGSARMPAQLQAVTNVTSGPLSLHCQKSGPVSGAFSSTQFIAIPTSP